MRKEVFIAILVGALLGGLFAFGVYRANSSLTSPEKKEKTPDKPNTVETTVGGDLAISSPLNASVSSTETIKIKGITHPNTVVTAQVDEESTLGVSDKDGNFEVEIDLIGGLNQIKVSSFTNDGLLTSEDLLVIFSSKLTSEEGSVEDRVENAENPMVAFLGTVTDITENAIQIQNSSDTIEQITIADETTFGNIVKEPDEVDFVDVAIGDFIAALGKKQNGDVLTATRVLITLPPEDSAAVAVAGTVVTLSSTDFIIKSTGEEWSIDAKGSVSVTQIEEGEFETIRFAQIDEGDTIIVAGIRDEDSGELDASSVHLLNKAPKEEE